MQEVWNDKEQKKGSESRSAYIRIRFSFWILIQEEKIERKKKKQCEESGNNLKILLNL